MEQEIECRFCGATLSLEGDVGRKVECPACHAELYLPPENLRTGLVLGDFVLEKHLGSGSMGHVFLAEQKSLQRKVAVKAFSREYAPDPESLQRFLYEMRLVAALDHPNIVTAFSAGEDHGVAYLAMSFVEGDDLEQVLKKQGKLPEQRVLQIGRKIADALRYAWNSKGILHRDIKPSNIRLNHSGEPMLLDLGVAKSTRDTDKSGSGQTLEGFIIGTPYYMSPEQARGRTNLDCRSDLYSLGATLYHLAVGAPPFEGDNSMAVLTKHITDPFPDPRARCPELSAPFAELLETMMAKEPDDRPANWDELLPMIGHVLKGRFPRGQAATAAAAGKGRKLTMARRSTPAASAPVAPRPNYVGVAVGWLLVLGLAGAAVVALQRYRTELAAEAQNFSKRLQQPPPPRPVPGTPVGGDPATPTTPVSPAIPVPPPTGTGPAPAAGAARLIEQQRRTLQELRDALATNPGMGGELAGQLRQLRDEAIDPALAKDIEQVLSELRAAQDKLNQAVVDRLRKEADDLLAAGSFDEAVQHLRDYAGPRATPTAAARKKAADDLQESIRQRPDYQAYLAKRNERQYLRLRELIAEQTVAGKFDSVRKTLDEAGRDEELKPFADKLKDLRQQVETAATLNQLVVASFQPELGQMITLQLQDGPVAAKVVKLVEGGVECERSEAHLGRLVRRVRPGDLTLKDRLRRLGDERSPARQLMRGLLMLEAEEYTVAERCFTEASGQLGEALKDLARHLASAAAAKAGN